MSAKEEPLGLFCAEHGKAEMDRLAKKGHFSADPLSRKPWLKGVCQVCGAPATLRVIP